MSNGIKIARMPNDTQDYPEYPDSNPNPEP